MNIAPAHTVSLLPQNAPLLLSNIPEEMSLACIPAIAQAATASTAFDPIADLVRRRMAASPMLYALQLFCIHSYI